MAVFQKEIGTAHGRGFSAEDPNGYLAKLDAWIVKAPGSGGPQWYVHDSTHETVLDGTEYYVVYTDTVSPTVNDINTGPSGGPPKFIQVGMDTVRAGKVFVKFWCWWDNGTQTGRGQWAGFEIDTYDDADFEYNFRGGAECMILQSRLGTAWYTAMWDEWTGDANFVEGTDKWGIVQDAAPGSGSSVVLTLDTGQGANFTQDKWYYLYDFNGQSKVNYVQVTNVSGDQITVDHIDAGFTQYSVIGAYVHRWVSGGDARLNTANYNYQGRPSTIPYCSQKYSDESHHDYTIHNQSGYIYGPSPYWSYENYYLSRMSPNDEGVYAVQRGGIVEGVYPANLNNNKAWTNRAYGTPKNSYVTLLGTMARNQDGRVIGGKNWLYFRTVSELSLSGSSSYAVLFLDTTALS